MSRGVDIGYIMDEMHVYEIPALLKYGYYREKESWEQTRWLGNLFINANSKTRVELEDTIKFSWEREDDDVPSRAPTREELEQMKNFFNRKTTSSSVTLKNIHR